MKNGQRTQEQKQFSSLRELATVTGKCYRTIHRAAHDGKIKTVRFGTSVMVPQAEVQRVLQHGWR